MPDFEELRRYLRDVRIVHHIRGRIRLKLEFRVRAPDFPHARTRGLQPLLDRIPGVRSVELNLLARSCTVHYDAAHIPERAWRDLLDGTESDAAAILERILHATYLEFGNAGP